MAFNLPGGKIFSGMGGYINLVSPASGEFIRLDVANWNLERNIKMFHKGHSGTLAAIASRFVALDWTASGRVWWDLDNPPDSLLLQGGGVGIQLGMGSLAGQQTLGQVQQQFYVSPSAMLRTFKVLDSSEGNDDDVVTADFVVWGNSLLFQLPAQLANYNLYASQLAALGQFNPLNAYTIMQ